MIPGCIKAYIDLVKSGTAPMCRDQIQLADMVERAFLAEDIRLDESQLDRYLALQKYFPYKLLPWEIFCFALHNCVYKANGQLRWPNLGIVVGRGAGKNGYLAFEDFCLLTPINGVKNYDIDIFAMSEEQAAATFYDIYNVLEGNAEYFKRFFEWTKVSIKNLKTGSILRYRTSAAKTKDGGRPGKVDFDEVHAYENSELMDTAITGLGKKRHPRRTIISTPGNVRGGPFDKLMDRAAKVLAEGSADGGWIYFICRLDSDDEIQMPERWPKANPSLLDPDRPELLLEIESEYQEYLEDPNGHIAFAVKRMGRIRVNLETAVTSWENILAASTPLPPPEKLWGRYATHGTDFASTQDFVAAGILIPVDGVFYWICHVWVCLQSPTLNHVKFPIYEAEARGELTTVDAPEIAPEIPVAWIAEQAQKYNLILGGIDHFRFTMLSRAFTSYGFDANRKTGNLKLTYTPEQSMVAPLISSAFINHKICWGDNMTMRWMTNNATRMIDKRGNISYGKIEPKSRKTDGFMAFVAAFICYQLRQEVFETDSGGGGRMPDVFVYA